MTVVVAEDCGAGGAEASWVARPAGVEYRVPPARGTRCDARPESGRQAEDRLQELMDQHERSLYSYVLALVHDHDLAGDCTQDTFVRAYELLRGGRAINRQWLYKVARNRAMDEFRRRHKERVDGGAVEQRTVEEPVDQRLIVGQTLDHLPALDRKVLYLFAVLGFKTDEIAEMLGTSGAAVRQRLYRARGQFRALYFAEA